MTETEKELGIKSAKSWRRSCDFCAYHEGRHYCLLHGIGVKNMNTKRCSAFMHEDSGVIGCEDIEAIKGTK